MRVKRNLLQLRIRKELLPAMNVKSIVEEDNFVLGCMPPDPSVSLAIKIVQKIPADRRIVFCHLRLHRRITLLHIKHLVNFRSHRFVQRLYPP